MLKTKTLYPYTSLAPLLPDWVPTNWVILLFISSPTTPPIFSPLDKILDWIKTKILIEKCFIVIFRAYGKAHLPIKAVKFFKRRRELSPVADSLQASSKAELKRIEKQKMKAKEVGRLRVGWSEPQCLQRNQEQGLQSPHSHPAQDHASNPLR